MEQRLPVLSQIGQQLHHILQVALGLDGFVYIIAAAFELVAAGGILDDLALLASLHQSVIDSQGHAAAVSELGKDRLFLGGGRIFPNHPHAAIAVTENIMIREKFYSAGQDHIKEILGAEFLGLLRRQYLWFSLEHIASFCSLAGRRQPAVASASAKRLSCFKFLRRLRSACHSHRRSRWIGREAADRKPE